MGKKPELVYWDEEGSLNSGVLKEYVDKEKIETHQTRTHPAFAERMIRTAKDMLFKRVEAVEKKCKDNIQWTDYIFEIMLTYYETFSYWFEHLNKHESPKTNSKLLTYNETFSYWFEHLNKHESPKTNSKLRLISQ